MRNLKNTLMNILTPRQIRRVTDSLSLVQANYVTKHCRRGDSSRSNARVKNALGAVLTKSQLRGLVDSLTTIQQDYLANIVVRDSRASRRPSRLNRMRRGRLNRRGRMNDAVDIDDVKAVGEFIGIIPSGDQELYLYDGDYYVVDVRSLHGPYSKNEIESLYNYDFSLSESEVLNRRGRMNRRGRRRRAMDMGHRRKNSEKEMEEAEEAEDVREKAEEAEESAEEVSELAAEIEEEEEDDVIKDQDNDMEMEEEDLLRENRGHRRNRRPRGNRRFQRSRGLDNSIYKMSQSFAKDSEYSNREDSKDPKEYQNAQRRLHSKVWKLSQDQYNKLAQDRSLKSVMEDLK